MQLPINLGKVARPIKPKYLDEETEHLSRWIVFGIWPDGNVDVHDPLTGADIFVNVTREEAEKIVAARDAFCDAIVGIVNGEDANG